MSSPGFRSWVDFYGMAPARSTRPFSRHGNRTASSLGVGESTPGSTSIRPASCRCASFFLPVPVLVSRVYSLFTVAAKRARLPAIRSRSSDTPAFPEGSVEPQRRLHGPEASGADGIRLEPRQDQLAVLAIVDQEDLPMKQIEASRHARSTVQPIHPTRLARLASLPFRNIDLASSHRGPLPTLFASLTC